ncbi:LLM class flavin-dependent oxidoreductase [Amycolatopsis sp. DSM 110486]|uniref:LLM class flavin-dependent oxidoreductase n=1 Tax=Amycolatopsis sp. DSM 110486 TaxID=2865832 RepID=UPI00351D977A
MTARATARIARFIVISLPHQTGPSFSSRTRPCPAPSTRRENKTAHGRAAWLVGATALPEALATVGRPPLGSDALRREVTDVVEVVRRLWDSWEDDAVIKDVATGRYLDPGKVHQVDFDGETFSVKGPLITPRPPQGSLVVLAPDTLADAARPDAERLRRPPS